MRGSFSIPAAWLSRQVHVAVVGCGGTGSEMVDGLARLHVVLKALGHPGLDLALFDDDRVSSANVGRQRFLPTDVGAYKAVVLAERYNFAYGLSIRAHVEQVHHAKTLGFGPGGRDDCRLLVTCVDKAKARLSIADSLSGSTSRNDIWLDCGNGKFSAQAIVGHCRAADKDSKTLRLPHVVDLFRAGLEATDDRAEPSCSVEESLRSQALGINRMVADFSVFSLIAPLFMTGSIDFHGGFIDMAKGRMSPLLIDTQAWSFLGYAGEIPKAATQVAAKPSRAPAAVGAARRDRR